MKLTRQIGFIKLRKPKSDIIVYREFHRSATGFHITTLPEDGLSYLFGTIARLDLSKIYLARKHEEEYECE